MRGGRCGFFLAGERNPDQRLIDGSRPLEMAAVEHQLARHPWCKPRRVWQRRQWGSLPGAGAGQGQVGLEGPCFGVQAAPDALGFDLGGKLPCLIGTGAQPHPHDAGRSAALERAQLAQLEPDGADALSRQPLGDAGGNGSLHVPDEADRQMEVGVDDPAEISRG